MKKRVPEEGGVLMTSEQEVEWLRGRLTANEDFKAVRGRLGISWNETMELFRLGSRTPAQAVKRFREFCGRVTSMQQLLSQLDAEGRTEAYRELSRVLVDPTYFIRGEEWPLEKTVPITVVMYDPARTFLLLEYLFNHEGVWTSFLGHYLDRMDGRPLPEFEEGVQAERWLNEAERLFQAFPSLKNLFREHRQNGGQDHSRITAVLQAHQADVLGRFRTFRLRNHEVVPLRWFGNDFLVSSDVPHAGDFGLMVEGQQKDALCLFPRSQQEEMGKWQFDVPLSFWTPNRRRLMFHFHPEEEHSFWRKVAPAFTSVSCSHGWGELIVQSAEADRWRPMSWEPLASQHRDFYCYLRV